MNRSTVTLLLVIVVLILMGFYFFSAAENGTKATGEQPSPHALDQSQ